MLCLILESKLNIGSIGKRTKHMGGGRISLKWSESRAWSRDVFDQGVLGVDIFRGEKYCNLNRCGRVGLIDEALRSGPLACDRKPVNLTALLRV